MCGIVGHIHFGISPVDASRLECATELLNNRGPDDQGIWIEGGAGLGHRRLSIIDMSEAGHQPMQSADGRYVIVFNGEVYNFREIRKQLDGDESRWHSNSDTEVVLAAFIRWGASCLERFHGMFAFAIWDRQKKRLFAARDRMGVKPFYYHQEAGQFLFASRPKAIKALNDNLSQLDEQALRFYLECGYIPAPYSINQGIKKLPPAHYLFIDAEGVQIERYWSFQDIRPDASLEEREESELLDELDELVERSVCSRMVSDVPLGAFLSGGIDSSLVVAMMQKNSSRPVDTFTIGFNEKRYDESGHAQLVADHLHTNHHCEQLNVDDLLNLVPNFTGEFDEPFFDSSAFPVMAVSRLARQHVAVSLSGDGADELFGGYHYYRITQALAPVYRLPPALRHIGAWGLGLVPKHNVQLLAAAIKQKDLSSAFAFSRSISKDYPSVLFDETLGNTIGIHDLFACSSSAFAAGISGAERGMRLDAGFTLPDDYLQKVDVGSMAFSLEAREPLLDHSLIEWAMRLPLKWKLQGGTNKYLLRKLAYRYIPREILERPKQGFAVPIDAWLRGPLKAWAQERIHEKGLFEAIPVDQKKVIELFALHESGARNVHPLLWAILMLLDYLVRWQSPVQVNKNK